MVLSGIRSTFFSQITFSAYKSSGESSTSTCTTRFDETDTTQWNHYHTEDGIFIAPSQGSICYWVIPTSGSSFTTQLMVSGSVRASNLFPRPGGADSSSAMVIFSTNKEHVGIQLSGSSEYVYGAGSSYRIFQSTFTRMLLHKS